MLKKHYYRKCYYHLMKALGIKVAIKKKRPIYIKVTEIHIAGNFLNRQFVAEKPNQKWGTGVIKVIMGKRLI